MSDPTWDDFDLNDAFAKLVEQFEQEGPIAGAPHEGSNGDSLAETRARKTRQILGLLAKAERTDNDEEALALSTKAIELQTQWAITEATIRAFKNGGEPAKPTRWTYAYSQNKSFLRQRSHLLHVVCQNTRVFLVLTGERHAELFGFEDDLEFATQLYQSLLVQMAHDGDRALFAHERKENWGRPLRNRYAWRRNHYIGYAAGVSLKLKSELKRVVAEASRKRPGQAELVLADRAKQAKALKDEVYPPRTLRSSRGGGISDWGAYGKGYTDGSQANVSAGGVVNTAKGHVGRERKAIGGR